MNVACDYEAPMQMLTTEKYIAFRPTGGGGGSHWQMVYGDAQRFWGVFS